MDENVLLEILSEYYGIEHPSLEFLREGGGHTFIVNGKTKYLLKVIGGAFADTARQSVSLMRYLEGNSFPVPKTILAKDGNAIMETEADGEKKLITLMEFIEGDEPDLKERASDIGALTGRLHLLMEQYPAKPVSHDRDFFIGRYLEYLRKKNYPRLDAFEKLGENSWEKVRNLPQGICHGDLHRGNLLQSADGQIYLIDFDTVCGAPLMFDIMVMCDMTDYFNLKQDDMSVTKEVYRKFLSGYSAYRPLSREEVLSFPDWIVIRHFQLQATILDIYGIDCIDENFIDGQLYWLNRWQDQVQDWNIE